VTPDEVVREITERAWRFGAAVVVAPGDHVMCDGLRVSGYFDHAAEVPTLAVARGADRWLGTMLHEYSHLTQWAEGAPVWKADETSGSWMEWVNGKHVRNAQRLIRITQELEADCERRAVRLMREMAAPVDVELYSRGANAYVHFYNIIAERRKWYSLSTRPYNVPACLAAANPTLDSNFTKTPKALRAALLGCID